jgi:predicted nucleic acid-binding Zn ribbon protein
MQNNWKNTGRMRLSKLIYAALFAVIPMVVLGQKKVEYPAVKVIEKDTVVIFLMDQAKDIAKQNEERKKLKSDVKIMNEQLKFKDSIITMQETQLLDFRMIKFDYDEIVKQMARQQKTCNDEKALLDKEIRKQRRQKFASIGVGVLSFGTLLYFYIHK